ncbi:MAG: hypothetical protein ACO25K_08325 [Candidatus Fonsibacter ubiquis]
MNLNTIELKVLLSSLQSLSSKEENKLNNEYCSVPSLYNKIFSEIEKMESCK